MKLIAAAVAALLLAVSACNRGREVLTCNTISRHPPQETTRLECRTLSEEFLSQLPPKLGDKPRLMDLYADGWRLIEAYPVKTGKEDPSWHQLYLEREK